VFSHDERFWDNLQTKKRSSLDSAHVGCHFFKRKHIFARIFRKFAQIFRDFAKVFTDFAQNSADFLGFSPNQNFWGCTCTSTSYTTAQWNSYFILPCEDTPLKISKKESVDPT